ncbi:MAG: hypothetical protein M1812_007325 [Candelaria pacifica]|nr:MAG: hypothetical protein M1812_007325 [Candelaria pacifica]
MSTTGVAKHFWTDAEKLELCLAIINQAGTGTPKWATLQLPKGRTIEAAKYCWSSLKKKAETSHPDNGSNSGTPKKRAPRKVKSATDDTPTTKRKRGKQSTKSAAVVNEDDDDDDDDREVKKMKTDDDEDDETKIKVESNDNGEDEIEEGEI